MKSKNFRCSFRCTPQENHRFPELLHSFFRRMSLAKQAGVLWDGFEGPARALAVKAGGEFHTLQGAPLADIKKAADEVIQDWIKNANSKGLDGQKLYDTAKSLISKYEKTL